jgi:hypothetical protein
MQQNYGYLVYALITVFAVVICSRYWGKSSDVTNNFIVLAVFTFVLSPYYLQYDMVMLILASVLLLEKNPVNQQIKLVSFSLWCIPLVNWMVIGSSTTLFNAVFVAYVCLVSICFYLTINNVRYEKDSSITR